MVRIRGDAVLALRQEWHANYYEHCIVRIRGDAVLALRRGPTVVTPFSYVRIRGDAVLALRRIRSWNK